MKPMTFERFGRSYHLRIASAADLARAVELDEAHWVATNAPVTGLNCDEAFLKILDSDCNGRITCDDLKHAIRWLLDSLSDTSGVDAKSDSLALSAINTEAPEAPVMLEAARNIIASAGSDETGAVTLAQAQAAASKGDPGTALLEKLIRLQAGTVDFANNFVSFPHLYDSDSHAMFEMGTVAMDARRFTFAVQVFDRAGHVEMTRGSNMYVMYIEVDTGKETKLELAVPVTSGGRGNLRLGKHGVFYDLDGNDHDAKIVDIIENPISMGEALASPFKRLGRLLTGKIEALTAQAEKNLDAKANAAITTPTAPQAKPGGLAIGGMIMGVGITIAALGSAAAYITNTVSGIGPLHIAGAIGGAILLVAMPTFLVSFLKLRKADLSAILEGSNWAINTRMRLTRSQRKFFTQKPLHPKSVISLRSPAFWIINLICLAAIAAAFLLMQYMLR